MLSPGELAQFAALPEHQRTTFLASRWAAKEALVKATGRTDLPFHKVDLQRRQGMAPCLAWPAAPGSPPTTALLSLSHETDVSVAVVVLLLHSE